jgi:hypothetical protein
MSATRIPTVVAVIILNQEGGGGGGGAPADKTLNVRWAARSAVTAFISSGQRKSQGLTHSLISILTA